MAGFKLDLTGKKFGRWNVISLSHQNQKGLPYWKCVCDCGVKRVVRGVSLTCGESKSCGCYHKERVSTHNMTGLPTFKSWDSMKQRCTNANSPDYPKYGGRGITVCDRWLNSFDNFLEDMGQRPKSRTLDRKDNNGNYEPDNCRWATVAEQLSNRRNTVKTLYNDTMYTIRELSEISGLKEKIIRDRLYADWPIEKIMVTPSRKCKKLGEIL